MTPEQNHQFMEAVANMRRLQKDFDKCKAGTTKNAMRKAEKKVDDILFTEIGKALQVQKAMFQS